MRSPRAVSSVHDNSLLFKMGDLGMGEILCVSKVIKR